MTTGVGMLRVFYAYQYEDHVWNLFHWVRGALTFPRAHSCARQRVPLMKKDRLEDTHDCSLSALALLKWVWSGWSL